MGGATYTSVVSRIARDCVTEGEDALHDLEKHTSGAALPDLLGMASSLGYVQQHGSQKRNPFSYHHTSSLGRFGFGLSKPKAKPKPRDNKIVVIFIIGGITCAEIQEIQQNVAEAADDGYQVQYLSPVLALRLQVN